MQTVAEVIILWPVSMNTILQKFSTPSNVLRCNHRPQKEEYEEAVRTVSISCPTIQQHACHAAVKSHDLQQIKSQDMDEMQTMNSHTLL